ncbi:MAG: tetratricopeptide repeat protein, partial [Myxococcota bacterium]
RAGFEALPADDLPLELAIRVWGDRGRLHTEANEREAGLRCHERASELARKLDDVNLRILTDCRLTNIVRMVQGPAAAVPMARRVLAAAESQETSLAAKVRALASLESSLTTLGEFDEAHRVVLRILARLDGRPDRQAGHRARLGFILQMQGQSEQAVQELERVFEQARNAGLDRVVVSAGRQLGNLLGNLGRSERAEAVYRTLLSVAERIGSQDGIFGARLGLASSASGTDPNRAIQLYEELRERALLVGRVREASVASLNIGIIEHGRERLDEAEAAYREALATIEPIGWRYVIAFTRSYLALLLDAMGRTDEARAALAEARPGARQGRRIRDAVAAALDRDPEGVEAALAADVPKEIAESIRNMIAMRAQRRGPEACS